MDARKDLSEGEEVDRLRRIVAELLLVNQRLREELLKREALPDASAARGAVTP